MANAALQQKRANDKFAKRNEKHRKLGMKKAQLGAKKSASPLSKTWIYVLAFLMVGGGLLELLSYLI